MRRVVASTLAGLAAAIGLVCLALSFAQPAAYATYEEGGTDAGTIPPGHAAWRGLMDRRDAIDLLRPPVVPPGDPEEVGSHTLDTPIRIKCGATVDEVRGLSFLVGTTFAERLTDGTRIALADAWFDNDSGDCGWTHGFGSLGSATFSVALMPGYHIDRYGLSPGMLSKHQLSVHEYAATDCSSSYVRTANDTGGSCSGNNRMTTVEGATDCHVPRVSFSAVTGSRSYKVEISVRNCWEDGTHCDVVNSDTGCFTVTWF